MKKFTASVTYNPDTVNRLSEAISRNYRMLPRTAVFLLGFVCLASGLFFSLEPAPNLLCIALGCFVITSIRVPARRRAAQDYKAIGGKPTTVSYNFTDAGIFFRVKGQEKTLSYEKLIRLSYDREFLYLFENRRSAYMIETATISPHDVAEFRAAVSGKTNLKWRHVISLPGFSLWRRRHQFTPLP